MQDTYLVILIAIGILALIIHHIPKARKYRKQIQSVSSMDRGTWSERDLIPKLINKCGINPQAIYHDLFIRKDDGTYTQIDLAVPTPQGIIVFEVKDYSGWIFGNGNSTLFLHFVTKEYAPFLNQVDDDLCY